MARILVIEDEPALRTLTRLILVESGHQVVEAGSARTGREALRGMPVDLVLTNVRLGGNDGITTLAEIHCSRPGLPLIAVSGGPSDEVADRLDGAGLRTSVTSLANPFTHDDLLTAVQAALAG
jgi:DNA-binding response OmpR family regulator